MHTLNGVGIAGLGQIFEGEALDFGRSLEQQAQAHLWSFIDLYWADIRLFILFNQTEQLLPKAKAGKANVQ